MKKIEFVAINNPRLSNGDFGFDWCDKCDGRDSALVLFKSRDGEFRLCKGCLLKAVDIINSTILKDAVEKGKIDRKIFLYGRET